MQFNSSSFIFLTAIFAGSGIMSQPKQIKYIVINDENQSVAVRQILKTPAEPFSFPLSEEDKECIQNLEKAFDDEGKIAGLAAPQIGIKKQAIIFHAPAEIGKWRKDFTEVVLKTIWLNPSYEAMGNEQTDDYEGCFSVDDIAGVVSRFQSIKYRAELVDGTEIKGTARGYIARVIQHEIDHLRGILFVDKIPDNQRISMADYYRMRDDKIGL